MQAPSVYPEIETPALVIDMDIVDANIAEMADLAGRHGVRLRPHTKTHKIPALAKLQLAAGANGIICSSLGEAEVMAAAGCTDIQVIVPLWGDAKMRRLRALRQLARVILSLDSVEIAEVLGRLGRESGSPVEVLVNVDTGDHRVGLPPGRPTADLVREIARIPGIDILGLFTHAGHSYLSRSPDELNAIARREAADLLETAELCGGEGIPLREIGPGTTPTARIVAGVAGVTEIRPGTYIFNNTMMMRLGVATERTVAARVISTVVARPTPDRVVIDAGTKSLSSNDVGVPGWIIAAGRDDVRFETLAVDVGMAHLEPAAATSLAIGDRLAVLPSCSVVDLFETAYLARGGVVEETVSIAGRGKVT